MKILYLSSAPFSDCDFPLIKEWQKEGHEVIYIIDLPCYSLRTNIINIESQIQENDIFLASRYKEFYFFKDYFNLENVYVINRTKKSAFSLSNIKIQFKLMSFIKCFNPDVISLTSMPDMFGCFIYQFRKKIVLTVHDPFPHSGEKNIRKMFFRRLAFNIIRKFVLLNKNQKSLFKGYWHLKDEQICVNKLGSYDCTKLYLKKNIDQLSNPNILFYGRISPYKGIEYLLEAMKIVHRQIPTATLTVAGSGKIYFDITPYEKLSYIEIQNNYIGMEELVERLIKCSIVICPYIDATQSGVVQTAFAMNRPVIATNVGAMGEYINNGKTGMLVSARDSNSLANSIIKILKTPGLLSKMEHNIINLENDGVYGWSGIAKKYIDFYRK